MKVKKRYRYTESGGADKNAWMVTFSDLMTLLMTFFVLLLSMSSMDDQKLKEMFGNLMGALGVLEYAERAGISGEFLISRGKSMKDLNLLELRHIQEMILEEQEKNRETKPRWEMAEVLADERGLLLRLPESVLFQQGSADLSPRALHFLNKLSAFLAESGHLVRVEGHTDNGSILSGRYRSNWELSMARATTVLRYLIDAGHLSPKGFSALAYAETRPIAPNDTDEGRGRNRRVELVLLRNKS